MRYTRRVLDRRVPSAVVAALITAAGLVASCSSEDEPAAEDDTSDAGTIDVADSGSPAPEDGAIDAPPTPHDAGPFDGAAPPVVCESSSCATSLSTTRGRLQRDYSGEYVEDPAEGFCAQLHDKTVVCWGANGSGQLGRGADAGVDDSRTPQRVLGLSNIVSLDHTCALDSSGKIWCWGTGPFLRNGAGSITTERTPVELPLSPATAMSVGFETGCAIIDGALSCWGMNSFGQVTPVPSASALPPTNVILPAGAPLRDVFVGAATFVVRADGTLVSWGANPPVGRDSTLFPDPNPGVVDLPAIAQLGVAYQDACAIVGGIGYCWGIAGAKSYQELSIPRVGRALPAPRVTPEPIRQIAMTDTMTRTVNGIYVPRESRWCACGVSGDVYCAGENSSGQAGDGTKTSTRDPVKVTLPGHAVEVKVMPTATCALLTSGRVFCWGSNFYGQLGSGKPKVPSPVPQEVVFP